MAAANVKLFLSNIMIEIFFVSDDSYMEDNICLAILDECVIQRLCDWVDIDAKRHKSDVPSVFEEVQTPQYLEFTLEDMHDLKGGGVVTALIWKFNDLVSYR